jgi:hypothetical protein
MFEQLNELKYKAESGKQYTIYFLKFWKAKDKRNDFIVKYQIRSEDKDFVWYGRISKERVMADLELKPKDKQKMSHDKLEYRIQQHLKKLLVHVIKKGLDKGFEEPNTEFVFYKKPPITKRVWNE